ncbi:hypothetical protein HAX54_023265, partial [Datura stramonium]|nr:hypothetical protein [Datura stramonium]
IWSRGLMEERMARLPNDGPSIWYHGSNGLNKGYQFCDGLSCVASCSGSTAPMRWRT